MLNATLKKEIINQRGRLDYEFQKRVLDFARALATSGPTGVPGKQLVTFTGAIPADELKAMAHAIEENCEQVNLNEW